MADDRIDAGHIYRPSYWPHEVVWKPRAGFCRAAVADGGRSVSFHQCGKRIKIERDVLHHGKPDRMGYCSTHDPVAVKANRKAREAKWSAEYDARVAARKEDMRVRQLGIAAVDAIKAIAKGHNDPRSLAIHVLTSCKEPIE